MSRSPALALVALGAFAACSSPARPDAASSAWRMVPTLPRRALDPGVTALGVMLVVVGGFDTGPAEGLDITAEVDAFDTTQLDMVDPSRARWEMLAPAPVHWTHINLAAIGGTLYIAGGLEGTQRVAHGEVYMLAPADPVDPMPMWHPIGSLPPGDERGASGVATASGRIYLLGGASSTAALASCLEYNVATQTWSHLPDLPGPRMRPAAMRRSDGTLIVAGGFESLDDSAPRAEVWTLPPPGAMPRMWTQAKATHHPGDPEIGSGCAYGVVLGQLVCAGGEAGQAASPIVESYDPFDDVWTVGESMPVPRTGTPGTAIGGRLFVPGGSATLALEPTDTLYLYAPLDTPAR